ncbi:hypothetical protein MCHI_000582 [Candidatus Magnetoovum chiemensis]|nr:hypothetical protein MCHI_000582 [Candidatus Magnetoovum chiemensis]
MEDFKFRQFTKEENQIYDTVIKQLKTAITQGLNYDQACASVDVQDSELKEIICSDLLKIIIAEDYYGKGTPLEDLSKKLSVSIKKLVLTREQMIEEVSKTASYHLQSQRAGNA